MAPSKVQISEVRYDGQIMRIPLEKDSANFRFLVLYITDDGEEILFEARGIAIIPDESQSLKWSAAGVFHFDTKSEKYKWLNSVLAVYEGELSMETGAHARYRAYMRRVDKTGS